MGEVTGLGTPGQSAKHHPGSPVGSASGDEIMVAQVGSAIRLNSLPLTRKIRKTPLSTKLIRTNRDRDGFHPLGFSVQNPGRTMTPLPAFKLPREWKIKWKK